VFVCTGNICRSPMAAALLRARLRDVAPEVEVASAGLLFDDRPAEPNAVRALRHRGLDLSEHVSRRLDRELVEGASLILGMERVHLRAVCELSPDLFPYAYTLPEFVYSAAVFGERPATTPLREWVERIGVARTPAALDLDDPLIEIADPMGGSRRTFRTCADELHELIDELVALVWPVHDSGDDVATATPGGIHADRDRR